MNTIRFHLLPDFTGTVTTFAVLPDPFNLADLIIVVLTAQRTFLGAAL
ncbi:hypothetical protein M917_1608 [Psychrobacter aquaticus CMS 56]|uniref:Uncharacterized protein n=1 Tax=Psychrobacter aquaticus CMS 56 TaxID=1354303 RepID=U4T5R8_9GAMM|nr:hypothetical protein M917_1608 [Psychrobacter aquaticus CMS 56]